MNFMNPVRGQKGISFIETVVALGVLGIIGVAFLTALQTISMNTNRYNERVTALGLAQSQVERIKAMAYDVHIPPTSYPVEVTLPPGYAISISEEEQKIGLQEVTVAVRREGRPVFHLKTIKANQ